MRQTPFLFGFLLFFTFGFLSAHAAPSGESKPNVLFILADDMGYGDLGANNPESKVATPHLDGLAAQSMRFTDAHAAGSVCVPSRFGLLTGCLPWRNELPKAGKGDAPSQIAADRPTLGTLMKSHGYQTAIFGKWHQGLGLPGTTTDFSKPIPLGPKQLGFDDSFILPASLDIPPYVYVENGMAVEPLTREVADHESPELRWAAGEFWRAGLTTEHFVFEEVLDNFTDRAAAYLKSQKEQESSKPFFVYVPLTAPHTPWLPKDQYRGNSGAGLYGDWVMQVDDCVGRILKGLEDSGQADNTLVFFSSDNGAFWTPEEIEEFGHRANGPLRGQKADAWEGGHRMPFLVRWPGKVAPGSVSDQLICFTDVYATLNGVVGGGPLPEDVAEDSISFLETLLGNPAAHPRTHLMLRTGANAEVREGDWKLIRFLGSGGFSEPRRVKPEKGATVTGQLYNLKEDLGETTNLFAEHPDKVAELVSLIEAIEANGRR